jgi:hypothetical protein
MQHWLAVYSPDFGWMVLDSTLLSDAEGGEDPVQDVVGRCFSGQAV